HGLRTVDGSHVSAALVVVLGHVYFVLGDSADQPGQALGGIWRVTAIGVALQQIVKGFVGFAQTFGVTLAGVLLGNVGQGSARRRKGDQPFQVQHIVGTGVAGVLLLETVDSGQGFGRLLVFPVDIGLVNQRLLCV